MADEQVHITHPERVLWPGDGITKGDLAAYYDAIAPVMLPHLKDRPITTKLYYDGIDGPGIYRREAPKSAPPFIRRAPYTTVTDPHEIEVPIIDDAEGLRWYVNSGTIEFHVWGAKLPEPNEPDRVVLDLDPGDKAEFAQVLEAALAVRARLTELGIEGLPKTSGGRGLHIWWALAPGYDFTAVREWVEMLAGQLAESHPKLIATAHGKTHSGTMITIDDAQNSVARNTAAVYTVRAYPSAPVSAPLSWDEIERGGFVPADFNLRTMPDRVKKLGDLMAPILKKGHKLPQL